MWFSLFYTRRHSPRLILPPLFAFLVASAIAYAVTAVFPLRRVDPLLHLKGTPAGEILELELLGGRGKEQSVDRVLALWRARFAVDIPRPENPKPERPHPLDPKEPSSPDELVQEEDAGIELPNVLERGASDEAFERAGIPVELYPLLRYRFAVWTHAATNDAALSARAHADAEPPPAEYNHVLADIALAEGRPLEAAIRFEREGLYYDARRADIERAIQLYGTLEEWDRIEARALDPKTRSLVTDEVRYDVAVGRRDARGATVALFRAWRQRFRPENIAISAISALAWAFVCARLGKLGTRPRGKGILYAAAFALGVASVAPTMVMIAFEEAKLRLVETGNPGRDVLFYVFGVGFREEAAKLVSLAPLLFLMRRIGWGSKLDVFVVGAFAGLGFAAEENLGYLLHGDSTTTLARFLTANFFHMAMTGILAAAFDDLLKNTEKFALEFSEKVLFVIGIHGGYDFLLSHQELGGSYFAMLALVFLTRMFLSLVHEVRGPSDRGLSLVHAFLLAVGAVAGVSFVHAGRTIGFAMAPMLLLVGMGGLAIVLFFVVRSLGDMH